MVWKLSGTFGVVWKLPGTFSPVHPVQPVHPVSVQADADLLMRGIRCIPAALESGGRPSMSPSNASLVGIDVPAVGLLGWVVGLS